MDAAPALAAMAVRKRGYCVVRQALPADVVEEIARQIRSELAHPSAAAESGAKPVDVEDRSTWPKGNQRRVVETVPPGDARAWRAVKEAPKFVAVLDELLGKNMWELPMNPSATERDAAISAQKFTRHWYCPVVFPDQAPQDADSAASPPSKRARGLGSDGTRAWTPAELAALRHAVDLGVSWARVAEELGGARTVAECKAMHARTTPWTAEDVATLAKLAQEAGGLAAAAAAPSRVLSAFQRHSRRPKKQVVEQLRSLAKAAEQTSSKPASEVAVPPHLAWTSVNRRSRAHQGWHIDIGPGFETCAPRVLEGHPFQGAVVLILLSDWAPGGGGTAVAVGSHEWVRDRLSDAGPSGLSHDELSAWAQARVAAGIHDGSIPYHRGPIDPNDMEMSLRIEQITGNAGDIAILHPLAVHSGTNNCLQVPRLMANGMVRITGKAFLTEGHPLMPRRSVQTPAAVPAQRREDIIEAQILAAARAPAASCAHSDTSLASVSVVLPVHNAAAWLDDCLGSLLVQTYCGPIELSVFDDGSTDTSSSILEAWAKRLESAGIQTVISRGESASGCGTAKNRAVEQSTGDVLVFLDADDIMHPDRIAASAAAIARYPHALVGCAWQRMPSCATVHYAAWANGLNAADLLSERFRETTVQMPTWCVRRAVFDATGPFSDALGEDHDWLLRHLANATQSRHAAAVLRYDADSASVSSVDATTDDPSRVLLARVSKADMPLLLYRWRPESESGKTTRRHLMAIKAAAVERDLLSTAPFCTGFTIWGVGRDGRALFASLSSSARALVRAFIDIDPRMQGREYKNHQLEPPNAAPVLAPDNPLAKPPCLVAVSVRRGSECGAGGTLEERIARAFSNCAGSVVFLC